MAENLTIRLPDDLSRALSEAAEHQHLIGSLESGIPDLAENHRTYLLDSIVQKHGR